MLKSHRRAGLPGLVVFLTGIACMWLVAACSGGGGGGGSGSAPVGVTAPVLLVQPQSVRVGDGQTATFSVTAVSSSAATYQWSRSGVPIPGATSATYSIATPQLSDDGAAFTVTVGNAGGTVTSAPATLGVSPIAPAIANNVATTVSVVAGDAATFAVTATGSAPLAFQWRRGGAAIAGAKSATYTIPSTTLADNGATFDVVVTNAAGSVTSAAFTLVVASRPVPPGIATQPASQSVGVGDPVTFTVVATGSARLTYQWQRNGTAIAGAQAATYTLPSTRLADSGAQFGVVVTNALGSVTSAAATLTVTARPSISIVSGDIGGPGSIDGTGTAARFTLPAGTAIDASGNVYVADNHAIRRITAAGVVTTFAGSDVPGSADGTGATASFRSPKGLVVDGAANVFVVDTGNGTIRKITPGGVVTTLAGLAGAAGATDGVGTAARFSAPGAIAIDAAGTLYVADTGNHLIRAITPAAAVSTIAGTAGSAGAVDGVGAAARFSSPGGLVVDGASNVFVADTGNSTIRRIAAGGAVVTLAGTAGANGAADGTGAAARFNGPAGIAIDAAGTLYVGDSLAPSIRKVSAAGVVTTLAGTASVVGYADGTGAGASFAGPYGIASDGAGTLYVADRDNYAVRRVDSGGVVTTFAGAPLVQGAADGAVGVATFRVPIGVAVDAAGNIYVGDYYNDDIRRIGVDGQVTTIAGLGGTPGTADGTGAAARFTTPQGIALDAAGNLYVADKNSHTIRKVTPAGVVTTLAGRPGVVGSADGTGAAATFTFPNAVVADAAGNVYVTDSANTIRKITPAGVVTTLAGTATRTGAADGSGPAASFNLPYGIAIDAAGDLYVADGSNALVRKVTPAGVVTTVAGIAGVRGTVDGPAGTATLTLPTGVAVDTAGNVFVADIAARTIRRIDPAGVVSTIVGVADGRFGVRPGALPGHLSTPVQLAFDRAGNLYVTDANAVLKVVLP